MPARSFRAARAVRRTRSRRWRRPASASHPRRRALEKPWLKFRRAELSGPRHHIGPGGQGGNRMGLVRTRLSLTNPKRSDLMPIEVEALVDTGAVHLCIPERIARQLQLDEPEKREGAAVDGSTRLVPYA